MRKLQETVENIAISKGVKLTVWTINICPMTILYKAFENIMGGKGAILNINYHYHYYFISGILYLYTRITVEKYFCGCIVNIVP